MGPGQDKTGDAKAAYFQHVVDHCKGEADNFIIERTLQIDICNLPIAMYLLVVAGKVYPQVQHQPLVLPDILGIGQDQDSKHGSLHLLQT
jgi:hypothetical protein